MVSSSTRIKTIYAFIGASIQIDVNSPMGNSLALQIYPYACQNLCDQNPEFMKQFQQASREQVPLVMGSALITGIEEFSRSFSAWLQSREVNISEADLRSKVDLFSGTTKNPETNTLFSWTMGIYFDLKKDENEISTPGPVVGVVPPPMPVFTPAKGIAPLSTGVTPLPTGVIPPPIRETPKSQFQPGAPAINPPKMPVGLPKTQTDRRPVKKTGRSRLNTKMLGWLLGSVLLLTVIGLGVWLVTTHKLAIPKLFAPPTPTATTTPTVTPTPLPTITPTFAPTAFGGGMGRIAYSASLDDNRDVFVMNADGTDRSRLTTDSTEDWSPSWSPDGNQIAFLSRRDGNEQIYLMNTDGTNVRRLTHTQANEGYPSWSPNGKKIVFVSDRDSSDTSFCTNTTQICTNIFVIDVASQQETRLTNLPSNNEGPDWSPDGKKIVFFSNRDGSDEIYMMNSDGSDQTIVTTGDLWDSRPRWSPDGTKIVFSSYRDGVNSEIYTMDPDGSNIIRLTNNLTQDYAPSWSPDGKHIAFEADSADFTQSQICTMDVNGDNIHCISDATELGWEPVWQPTASRKPMVNLLPTTTPYFITPKASTTSFAIQGSDFQGYQDTCDTDATINSVNGTSLSVGGTISMINGNWEIFCIGAKHTWIGKLTYAGYTFDSDLNDPLQFRVDASNGYVYVGGKGKVTAPDGTVTVLGN